MTFDEHVEAGMIKPRCLCHKIMEDWQAEREVFLERIEGLQNTVTKQDADREEQAKVYAAGMAEAESQIDRLMGEKERLAEVLREMAEQSCQSDEVVYRETERGQIPEYVDCGKCFSCQARAILSELDERKEEE